MINIRGCRALKLSLAVVFATLFLGSVAALEWETPGGSGEQFDSDIEFNITHENNSRVSFQFRPSNQEDFEIENTKSIENGYASQDFSLGSGLSSGEYVLKANTSDGDDESIESVMFDGKAPEIRFPDKEFVNSDPTISVEVKDDHTGPDSSYDAEATNRAEVSDVNGFNSCSVSGWCNIDVKVNTDEVGIGYSFTVEMKGINDQVGNSPSISERKKQFVFDDAYQAEQPEFSIEEADENNNVDLTGDVEVDITVNDLENEESDVKIYCRVDGEQVDETGWQDDEDFECEIPEDEVMDESVDVSVEACDRAGNCEESEEIEYTFDSTEPEVDSFEIVKDYDVFKDDFMVSYDVSDQASGIEKIEYFFDPSTAEGDGHSIDSDGDGEFEVDTALIQEEGDKTVYFRAEDKVGRWSDITSVDFQYRPGATAQASIDADEDFSVDAGAQEQLDVVVENTGKLLIESMTVEASSQLFNSTRTVEDLKQGDRVNAEFDVSPDINQTGPVQVEFDSSSPDASDTIEMLVEANDDQIKRVDNKLEKFSEKRDNIRANVSDLQVVVNQNLNSSLQSGTSSFVKSVEKLENYTDEGTYYKALSVVQGLDSSYQSAVETVQEVREQHRENELRNTLMIIGLILVAVVLAGLLLVMTGYREIEDQIELPESVSFDVPENEFVERFSEFREQASEKFDELKQEIQEKIEQREEEAEEKFEGFR